jgi:PilZ domain
MPNVKSERQPRPVGGVVRLLLDTPDGLITTIGQILDVSEEGCALRTHRPVEAHVAGRVSVQVGGKATWLPIRTRWSRPDSRGWTIGCEFDRPTPEKQHAIRALLKQRQRLRA